jgi:hypothetical protein
MERSKGKVKIMHFPRITSREVVGFAFPSEPRFPDG